MHSRKTQRKPGPRKVPLSSEQIVDAALGIVEKQEAEALSMRRVAAELDVATMSLYTYFPAKSDLVSAVVDRVAGLVTLPDPEGLDWRTGLTELARSLRLQLKSHPGIAGLVISQPTLGPNSLGLGEFAYSVMGPAGFSDEAMASAFYCLFVFVLGFVALEMPRVDAGSVDQFERGLDAFFAGLPVDRFPHTVRMAQPLSRFLSDQQFEEGIKVVVEGIASQSLAK